MSRLRRTRGEGSTGKRADGTFWARTAAPERKYFYSRKSLSDAVKKRAAYVKSRPANIATTSGDDTWSKYCSAWLASEKTRVRIGTWEKWSTYIKTHVSPHLDKLPLSSIKPQHIVAVLDACDRAPSTKAGVRYAMLRAFAFAVDLGLIATNPVENKACKPPRVPKTAVRPLTGDAYDGFLAALTGHTHAALLRLYLLAGLRCGEAIGLSWSDLDLDAGTAHIRQTVQRRQKKLILAPVKTDAGIRVVPLDPDTVSAIRTRKRIQAEHRMKLGEDWEPSDLVFTTGRGTMLEPRNVLRLVQNLLAKHKLPRVSVHALRHTAATHMLAAGVDPRTVIEIFGWSSIRMLDRYAHAIPGRLDRAREVMARATASE